MPNGRMLEPLLKIVGLKRSHVHKETIKLNWTDHAEETIEKIANEWIDTGHALAVLLFFNYNDDKEVYAYMPIIPTDRLQRPDVRSLPGAKKEARVIGIKPLQIEGEYPIKEDIDFISTDMGLRHNWFGTEAFLLSVQGRTPDYVIKAQLKGLSE